MPIAFTAEERTVLTGQLLESARRFVKEQSARKVTVEQLTDSVGISKGAFYLFYPSKEHLFYALLRQMHTELYGPAMELLEQPKGTPAQQLTCAILEGCRALDESGLWSRMRRKFCAPSRQKNAELNRSRNMRCSAGFWRRTKRRISRRNRP